ncbi:MAG: 2-C-methyl-D-erythritol 4-phosphate cytidylyltransferase [Eubacteriales bacterium]|jgi:2-C-methyl-D-erythritol 4-phosphate cytidylyltransferase
MGFLDKWMQATKKSARKGRSCCAVIVAAGSGKRMGTSVNKQFLEIQGKPVLAYTLEAFEQCDVIDGIIVVAKSDEIPLVADLIARYDISKGKKVVAGGPTRQDSVWNGLMAAEEYDFVAIHDGARPFVHEKLIQKAVEEAWLHQAAAVGMPVSDTIKRCDVHGQIVETVDRSDLWAVQTPQVFDRALLIGAHRYVQDRGLAITDDCMAIEAMGGTVRMVQGDISNIKITTAGDLPHGEAILAWREEEEA